MGDDRPAERMNVKESGRIYLRRINRVIDHIAENLAEPLPLAKLAKLAHFSPFHFHRIFRSLVGEPERRTASATAASSDGNWPPCTFAWMKRSSPSCKQRIILWDLSFQLGYHMVRR
jgi:hypothetical protein